MIKMNGKRRIQRLSRAGTEADDPACGQAQEPQRRLAVSGEGASHQCPDNHRATAPDRQHVNTPQQVGPLRDPWHISSMGADVRAPGCRVLLVGVTAGRCLIVKISQYGQKCKCQDHHHTDAH